MGLLERREERESFEDIFQELNDYKELSENEEQGIQTYL